MNLKTYEGQTILSTALAVLGAVASVATWGLLVRRFDRTAFYVSFNSEGLFQPVLGLGLLVGLGAGVIGFFMALKSAGHKRNNALRAGGGILFPKRAGDYARAIRRRVLLLYAQSGLAQGRHVARKQPPRR